MGNGTAGNRSNKTNATKKKKKPEPHYPTLAENATGWFHPVDGGKNRKCGKANKSHQVGEPGSGKPAVEVPWNVSSLKDCKSVCINATRCGAISYDSRRARCQIWTEELQNGSTVAQNGTTCLTFRPKKVNRTGCSTAWPKPKSNESFCSKVGENCLTTGCCQDPTLSCFSKDGFWAACRPVCEPGVVDVTEAPENQAPWSCAMLGCGSLPGRFIPPGKWWKPPKMATEHNGVRLADTYMAGEGPHHVFIIGDWGGTMEGGGIIPANQIGKRVEKNFIGGVDDRAQFRVRDAMRGRAGWAQPKYVLNVGDNFYWAGIEEQCNSGDINYMGTNQFQEIYENVYTGYGLDGIQWLGVLGNHDYGGFRFEQGWDKAVGYTWGNPNGLGRWMTPALYYSAKVYYPDFSVDYLFMDTNVFDAMEPWDGSSHNICSQYHNPGGASCAPVGPKDVWDCPWWFRGLWDAQKKWLNELSPTLNGDWRIVVTHFPPYWGHEDWVELAKNNELDLIISGHRHSQHLNVPGDDAYQIWPDDWEHLMSDFLNPTSYAVSGGGGGVTSEQKPEWSGEDDEYGFMDMTLTKETILLESISHGGQTRKVATVRHEYPHDGSRSDNSSCSNSTLHNSSNSSHGNCSRRNSSRHNSSRHNSSRHNSSWHNGSRHNSSRHNSSTPNASHEEGPIMAIVEKIQAWFS